ncbi:rhodanese-like domain-containing protein [Aureivirga sp. CE67]|uniref:rhodanese-like domain-containing protein n=1 Tax=Aureivirga sp. CE67 TaxID=1788983 RepID=UPI0018CA8802|nr:rhodanese-like domain-containing protein [Aureivirga sp. CE67]
MSFFNLFGNNNNGEEIKSYLEKGAVVIDVRTVGEFAEGHVPNSTNIVLDTIPQKVEEIKAINKPIIAVCKSGGRSGQATEFLAAHGLDIINGGPWQNVNQYIEK